MGDQLGTLVDELLDRTRDAGGAATTRAQVRKLLRHAEAMLGVHGAHVESFTFFSVVNTGFYSVLTMATGGERIGRILDVRVGGKSLSKATINDLRAQDPRWARVRGDTFETWTQWGWDLFVLWPVVPVALVVEVVATAAPVALDETYTGADTDTLSLTTKWSPQVVDLAEVLMLLRWRRLDALQAPLARLQGVLKL